MVKKSVNTYEQLCNTLISKRIACFGAGEALHKLFAYYQDELFVDNIGFVIDNSPKKWDTMIAVDGHNLKIRSVDYLLNHLENIDALIISSVWEEEIAKQLDDIEALSNLPYYSYDEMKRLAFQYRMETARVEIIKTSDTPLIPKVIHYCWFGGNPIPEKYKAWMESWKKFCPEYKIVEWNESNYDYTKNKYMYDAYKAEKWAFVTDYARLDIIYEYGGIYLDTDVEVVKNIDDFLYQKGFAGFQPDGRVATGLGFGAVRGLPIIKRMRDAYEGYIFVDFKTKEERIKKGIKACPTLQTEYLRSKGLVFRNKVECVEELNIYPAPMLCGKDDVNNKLHRGENTYLIHHFEGSWVPGDKTH